MNIILPEKLERKVTECVDKGDYASVSELIEEALQQFFQISDDSDDSITPDEAERIRQVIEPRLAAVKAGTAKLIDAEDVFEEIERKYFR